MERVKAVFQKTEKLFLLVVLLSQEYTYNKIINFFLCSMNFKLYKSNTRWCFVIAEKDSLDDSSAVERPG